MMLEGDIGECCLCHIGIAPKTEHYKHIEELGHGEEPEITLICEDCYKQLKPGGGEK